MKRVYAFVFLDKKKIRTWKTLSTSCQGAKSARSRRKELKRNGKQAE